MYVCVCVCVFVCACVCYTYMVNNNSSAFYRYTWCIQFIQYMYSVCENINIEVKDWAYPEHT